MSNMNEVTEEELIDFIINNKNIVIYGAGVIGQALYYLCSSDNVEDHIVGFAVSSDASSTGKFERLSIKKLMNMILKNTFL